MEEKIVRNTSLVMALLVIFICSSLCYLPSLEAKAQQYVAMHRQLRLERQQREQMWETLSGLEFLDYSTRQAMTTASDMTSGQDADGTEGLTFTQQLRVELPKNVSREQVTIENHHVSRTIDITIKGAGADYLVRYPMLGRSDHIEELNYFSDANSGTLELVMEHVYELTLDWEDRYLYIDFVSPRDIYDRIVVIDAGHGANMPGAIVDGVQEKDIDLAIVKEIKALFDATDDPSLGVYYTRLDDSDPAFADRSGLANDTKANLFVSIHNNSYVDLSSVHGTAVLYDEKKSSAGNSSKHFAEILLNKTTVALQSKTMGLVPGNNIYIVRTSEAPVALIEVGFMTNPQELENLTNPEYQKKCARAIYEGIMQALEEGY